MIHFYNLTWSDAKFIDFHLDQDHALYQDHGNDHGRPFNVGNQDDRDLSNKILSLD